MCVRYLCGVAIGGCLFLSAIALARDFGPEWTRDGLYYRRTVETPVTHSVDGNITNYKIRLDHDEISIGEIDDNAGFGMGAAPYGRLEVSKANGAASSINVQLKKHSYHDLDANGVLDTMTDGRGVEMRVFIFIDGQQTEVALTRLYGHLHNARSLNGMQKYIFKDSKWRILGE